MHPLEPLDPRTLGTRARLAQTVLINRGRVAKDGVVRPVIESPILERRFSALVGRPADSFALPTRVFQPDRLANDAVIVRDGEGGLPLIVRRAGQVVVNFDLRATRAFEFRDSKRPLYTYLPGFDIHKVPEWFRRPVSNLVQAMRSGQRIDVVAKYRSLPLTSFECAALLVAVTAGDDDRLPFRWPSGYRSAFLSLHDVDTAGFLERRDRDPLLRVEHKHGIRSCWFVPTKILRRDEHAIDFLLDAGHEVGWHGHKHDHRDHVGKYADRAVEALRGSRLNLAANFPTGMRLPKLLKSQYLFGQLERSCAMLQYDTSFVNGVLPYPLWLNGRPSAILEIPTTVPTDIHLYNELHGLPPRRRADAMLQAQMARTEKLMAAGGLITIVTHPEKGLSERPDFLRVYDEYLGCVRSASDVWFPTAGELFRYWTGMQSPSGKAVDQPVATAQAMAP